MQTEHLAAVGSMYVEHRPWLQAVLSKKLGCTHRAEDLTHDTFVKVLKSQAGAALREPRAFLSTVAHGLVVSYWRHLDLERAYLAALGTRAPAFAASPEERALVLEALLEIDALLAGLPAKASRAFLMAQLDGMSYAEIADELGVSDRMVKKYMASVMHHLLINDA